MKNYLNVGKSQAINLSNFFHCTKVLKKNYLLKKAGKCCDTNSN